MEYKIEYHCPNDMFDEEFMSREIIERQAIDVLIRSLPIEKLREVFHVTVDSVKEGVIVDTWL